MNQHVNYRFINDLLAINDGNEFENLFMENYSQEFQLKDGLSPSKKNCFISFYEISLKMMKNAFYFILKALFVLIIFKFLS